MRNDIIFGAVLPYVAFLIARHYGFTTVHALAIGSLFPIAIIVVAYVRSRRIAAIGVITLSATVASLVASLYFDSAYLALLKNSLITATVGVVFAASLFMRRPLIFHLASEKGSEERESIDRLWEVSAPYRALMRQMTVAWAVVLIGEAIVRALLIPLLPVDVFLIVSEAMWIIVFAAMIAWSMRYGNRRGKAIAAEARAKENGAV